MADKDFERLYFQLVLGMIVLGGALMAAGLLSPEGELLPAGYEDNLFIAGTLIATAGTLFGFIGALTKPNRIIV